MTLTAELISEFVKSTKDTKKQKDINVYGTAVEYGGKIYVKIDGSDLLTPVETTTVIKDGERVIVKVKDHKATVTGNLTSPSVSEGEIKDINNEILKVRSEFKTSLEEFETSIVGTFVPTEDLNQVKQDLQQASDEALQLATESLQQDISTAKQDVESSISTLSQDYSGFKQTVAATYATNTDLEDTAKTIKTTVSELQQDYDGFKTTVAETYTTQDDFGQLKTSVSEVSQTADKINFIVASGDSSSSMTLTNDFYNVVSENIELSADRINLEGLTTVNENFKILTDGTCEASDLVVTNNISTNTLIAESINVPWISKSLTRNVIVHINPSHVYSNSDYTLEDEDTFQSISDLLEICPRNLNGYKLEIYLDADITENVSLTGLNNGRIDINLKGYSLKGYIYGNQRTCRYYVYGDDSENTGGSIMGKIIPGAVGYLYNDRRYAICCKYGYLTVFDVEIYAGTATDYDNNCITVALGGNGYLSNVKAVNTPNSLLRCQGSSHCYVSSSSGITKLTTFQAISGSIIQLNDTTQAGRSGSTTYIYELNNGKIYADGVTWDTAAVSDSGSANTNTETTTTVTKSISSDYGDSYRTTVYNNWKKDNTVRQGQYGYGMNKGCWFFGNDIYEILQSSSNTIVSMTITIKRQSGGVSAAHNHYLRAHTYKTRPSGEPTLLSSDKFSQTFSLATGQSINISLTSSQISALKTNKAKGFGLYTTSTSTGLYSVCSGSCTVKIKYKTTES